MFDRQDETPHVGIIDISGEIADSKTNADDFNKGLNDAYKNKGLKALIIRFNSPGGSPVQAEYMYNSLQYFKQQFPEVKTYAVCVDLCASAAYYVAAGADEIYASPASLVGIYRRVVQWLWFCRRNGKIRHYSPFANSRCYKAFLDPFFL